jgi:hypothetical protein
MVFGFCGGGIPTESICQNDENWSKGGGRDEEVHAQIWGELYLIVEFKGGSRRGKQTLSQISLISPFPGTHMIPYSFAGILANLVDICRSGNFWLW